MTPLSLLSFSNKHVKTATENHAKRCCHVGRIYQKRYFAKEVDSRLGLLTISSYIHRNPLETKVPMVENLELYTYTFFPLYSDEGKSAPPFLDRELLRGLLPPPFEKTNLAYAIYCLTYQQNAEEDPHIEDMEPAVFYGQKLADGHPSSSSHFVPV